MGKSFVEEETSSAVLTLLGRGYRASMPSLVKGEADEEVRNRMARWKARVETVQSITVQGGCPLAPFRTEMSSSRDCSDGYLTEEDVL